MAATQGEYQGSSEPFQNLDFETIFYLFVLLPLLVFPWLAAILARSKSWWAGGVVGALLGGGLSYFFAFGTVLTLVFVFGAGFIGLLLDFVVSRSYTQAKASSGRIPWWAGSGGFGGGSSRGGGFGGFGGGSSGGGGASGGW
jgi:uncharacterized protein